tara:strand:+ start:14872 stop:15486 length:615 start_codon:yes stop_codon:yes gene_type:complete
MGSITINTWINDTNLWTTPLFNCNVPIKPDWLKYIKDNTDKLWDDTQNPNGSYTTKTDLHTHKIFEPLNQILKQVSITTFGKNVESVKVANMWANILKRGEYHLLHTHNEHTMSGAYYLKVPENSGQLYFRDPRPNSNSWTQKFLDKGNMRFFDVKEGDLYFWPSFLDHGTTPHGSDEERITISFDLDYSGPNYKFGDNGYNGQ